jgi:hypothetical protein
MNLVRIRAFAPLQGRNFLFLAMLPLLGSSGLFLLSVTAAALFGVSHHHQVRLNCSSFDSVFRDDFGTNDRTVSLRSEHGRT